MKCVRTSVKNVKSPRLSNPEAGVFERSTVHRNLKNSLSIKETFPLLLLTGYTRQAGLQTVICDAKRMAGRFHSSG